MKRLILLFTAIFFLANSNLAADNKDRSLLEKVLNRDLPGGAASKSKKKKITEKAISKKANITDCKETQNRSLLEKIVGRDLPGGSGYIKKCKNSQKKVKIENSESIKQSTSNNHVSLYTGTFDIIDKEGDDQTNLFGVEHKNPNLFRNTYLGRFSPISGGFMTGDSSVYLYTGIEGQYGIGPLKILPSFAPGYYEAGNGKDLGSVLEFKSEIKVALDIFDNSKIGYSYSHISNNDWAEKNPGTDNQQITFSKNF